MANISEWFLNLDIVREIAKYLDPYTGNNLALTCKLLRKIFANFYEKPWHASISYDIFDPEPHSCNPNSPELRNPRIIFHQYPNDPCTEYVSAKLYIYNGQKITIYRFATCWNRTPMIYRRNDDNFAYYLPTHAIGETPEQMIENNYCVKIITMSTLTKIISKFLELLRRWKNLGGGSKNEYYTFADGREYKRLVAN